MRNSEINIAFYVSGKASRLRHLLTKPNSKLISSTKLVVSDSLQNKDLQHLLTEKEIRFECFDYQQLTMDKGMTLSNRILSLFNKYDISHCFCFGDHILKGALLKQYKNKIINFHPSILPHYKGRHAVDLAVRDGAQILGNTAHFLTEKVDGGPIIIQSGIHISQFELKGYDAVLDLQIDMVNQIYEWIYSDRITIVDERVYINGAGYTKPFFIPQMEI